MHPTFPRSSSELRDSTVFWRAALGYLFRGRFRLPGGHVAAPGARVPDDFPGICVASMDDPACDDLMLGYLRQLGIEAVRLDYGYAGPGNHPERFLNRLLDDGFKVLLRLIPPPEEARQMLKPATQQRWRQFVAKALLDYGDRIEAVEIGNTVNRRAWAGFTTINHFMQAWHIAHELARERGVTLAGPNVSDFEPPLNAGFLALMAKRGCLPDIHTDNLFVERAFEPEFYDRKILGRRLGPLHKLNLVKKARLLGRLGIEHGVDRTWSTTAFWTIKRIVRRLARGEDKQADYIVRYMVLAAASGGLGRAYWGPLVSQREGLVDDGTGREADHELVAFYDGNNGHVENYRIRPALRAYANFIRLIPGTTYTGGHGTERSLQIHAFESSAHRIHVLWTVNARAAELKTLYRAEDLAAAEAIGRDGELLDEMPCLVTETPLYLRWPLSQPVSVIPGGRVLKDVRIDGNRPDGRYYLYRDERWFGLVFAADRQQADRRIAALHPDSITPPGDDNKLRKSRNVIWTLDDPGRPDRKLVAKKPHRLKLNKRITDALKPAKSVRSWNGACELLRHGIHTPLPVATFSRSGGVDTLNNWYICEYAGDVPSVKDFFMAYSSGALEYRGISRGRFFDLLCRFVLRLHEVGVYFRDLTGGNILVHQEADGEVLFSLIDTGRARFYPGTTPFSKRMADLARTCYKLDWPLREEFMGRYLGAHGKRFGWRYRLPFVLFDWKLNTKRRLKGKKRQ